MLTLHRMAPVTWQCFTFQRFILETIIDWQRDRRKTFSLQNHKYLVIFISTEPPAYYYIVCIFILCAHSLLWNRSKIKNWNSKHKVKWAPWITLSINLEAVTSKYSMTKTTSSRWRECPRCLTVTAILDRRWGPFQPLVGPFVYVVFAFHFLFLGEGHLNRNHSFLFQPGYLYTFYWVGNSLGCSVWGDAIVDNNF